MIWGWGDVLTETGSHFIPRLVLNFQSSCLRFLGGGITEVSCHAQLLAWFLRVLCGPPRHSPALWFFHNTSFQFHCPRQSIFWVRRWKNAKEEGPQAFSSEWELTESSQAPIGQFTYIRKAKAGVPTRLTSESLQSGYSGRFCVQLKLVPQRRERNRL